MLSSPIQYLFWIQNVFTDVSLTEPGNLGKLDTCICSLRAKESQLLSSSAFRKHPTQLVIQCWDSEAGREEWFYYFVNHDSCAVFWVDDFDLAEVMPQDILGVTEDSHISELWYWFLCLSSDMISVWQCMPLRNNTGMLVSQYLIYQHHSFGRWHCEQYPNSVPLLQEHVTEVWGTVAYAYIGLTKLALCFKNAKLRVL